MSWYCFLRDESSSAPRAGVDAPGLMPPGCNLPLRNISISYNEMCNLTT
jgi:hypothetical protein